MGHVLALDLGSSSVRALVLQRDASPAPAAVARRHVELRLGPRGEAEFDPEPYLDKVVSCIDELNAGGMLDDVGDVAVASQWHSVLALDARGTPRSSVLTWADTRNARRPRPPEDPRAFHARTGAWPHWQYWTVRAPWLLAEVPSPARLVGLPELLGGRLLGDESTSVSIASGTGLLNWSSACWDDEALDLADLDPARLPSLQDRGWHGRLLPAWQRRWPPLADATWHPAVGDGAAASVGSGCGGPTAINVTIGTSSAVRVVEPAATAGALSSGLWRYRVDEDRVVSGVALSSGGGSYAWACRLGGLDAASPDLNLLADVPVGSNGVTVLPFHGGARAPREVPAGSAAISGLGPASTAADVVSATMEAVCFEVAEALDAVSGSIGRPIEVVACGGALEASSPWRTRLAAVLARPLGLVRVAEASARGAALIAAGDRPDAACPVEPLQPERELVQPAAVARSAYETLRATHGIPSPITGPQ